MRKRTLIALAVFFVVLAAACSHASAGEARPSPKKPKIYVAFHWHMHQPIYWPYEKITQTASNPNCTDAVNASKWRAFTGRRRDGRLPSTSHFSSLYWYSRFLFWQYSARVS